MRWRLIAHPYFTGALAVLALNDHVLKRLMPSFVTGKLSDFAGLFVVSVGLAALTARPRLSTCTAGLGFAAIKLWPVAAELVAPLLGGVTRPDPADLVAIAVLMPAYRFSRSWFPSSIERSMASLAVTVVSGSLAVLTVSATSCVVDPGVDAFVVGDDGTAFARVDDMAYDAVGNTTPAPRWAFSTDGGASWRPSPGPPPESAASSRRACAEALGCFRVDHGRVEHADSPGASFAVAFAFTREQRTRMSQRVGLCGVEDRDLFRSVALVDRHDGVHVVVAMGSQGVLHRAPDGAWSRVAVLDRKPVSLFGPSWLQELALTPLVLIALSPVPLVLGWRRQRRRRGAAALLVAAVDGVILLFVGGVLPPFFAVDYVIVGPMTAVLTASTLAASLALVQAEKKRPALAGESP